MTPLAKRCLRMRERGAYTCTYVPELKMPSSGILLLLCVCACYHQCQSHGVNKYLLPPAQLPSAAYPEWAHYHWVWLSSDRANQSSMTQYAKEYMEREIEIGAVDIDSGWSTGYNDFVFDEKKYPNPSEMIQFFQDNSIKVLLWATSMVNNDSPNYKEAKDKGYFIQNALGEQALISWWHGKGSLLDYTNPDALKWWHQQMDKALAYGIDGWKCDGTDPYILLLGKAKGSDGVMRRKRYSDLYYGDFFNYTRTKLGENRLIMSRPVDGYAPAGIYLDYSPPNVMYAGWVGDQDPDFKGLENALKRYLQSAWAGYANFGSDIGGYRSGGDTALGRTNEVFVRWAQLGAFSPLMENGGNKEHRPWMFDANNQTQTVDNYRMLVNIHYQLVDYLLTTGSDAFDKHKSSITPQAPHENFIEKKIDDFKPSTYNYLLGADIFVAPLLTGESTNLTVKLPRQNTSSGSWVYWWDHNREFNGTAVLPSVPLNEYPVFFAKGRFIPLRVPKRHSPLPRHPVSRFSLGMDLWAEFPGYLRWLLHVPRWQQGGVVTKKVRESLGNGIIASYWWMSRHCLSISVTAHPRIKSLFHLAGLAGPLRELRVTRAVTEGGGGGGRWNSIKEGVASLSKLKGLLGGGYLEVQHSEGGNYHVLINPGEHSFRGHIFSVCI